MVLKASINGPNRRHNRVGDKTIASTPFTTNSQDFKSQKENNSKHHHHNHQQVVTDETIPFRLRPLEKFLAELDDNHNNEKKYQCGRRDIGGISAQTVGNACLFTVGSANGMGRALVERHFETIGHDPKNKNSCASGVSLHDPVLIHFHDIPIFVLRAIPIELNDNGDEEDVIYVSQAHCHNHKICEDLIYTVTCCSRPIPKTVEIPPTPPINNHTIQDYDKLSSVAIDVHRRYSTKSGNDTTTTSNPLTIDAKQIGKELMNQTDRSILTINESLILTISNTELVCRVSRVRVQRNDDDPILGSCAMEDDGEEEDAVLTSTEASMEEPYRGRVHVDTEFYVAPSVSDEVRVVGARVMAEEEDFPDDVVHVTTSDKEWFPVRRILLVPCIRLTRYVQAGRGKYATSNDKTTNNPIPTLSDEQRSPDAPTTDGRPHCLVPIDCCTFDRVLLFIMSLLFPGEYRFALDFNETNALCDAAEALGLQPLVDLCTQQSTAFESRVRKDRFIRMKEVRERNATGKELILILDGMVLDITRWIDEHPGGPSIIPTQALNIDSTVFFEMYHVSRQSFLYLKSFYIGELWPEDSASLLRERLNGDGACASEGFLQSLRSYTNQWRVTIEENVGKIVHNSL